ncbi:MAG: glycosyltransferase family 2 protein, partial [Dehalococcoidia bacterium]
TWLSRIATGYWHLSDPQNGFTAISKKALEDIKPDTLYSFYGNANDILVRLNINHFKIQDVPMPSRYGEEKSSIKYRTYIPKVSLLLLRRFVWRLWKKYIKRGL